MPSFTRTLSGLMALAFAHGQLPEYTAEAISPSAVPAAVQTTIQAPEYGSPAVASPAATSTYAYDEEDCDEPEATELVTILATEIFTSYYASPATIVNGPATITVPSATTLTVTNVINTAVPADTTIYSQSVVVITSTVDVLTTYCPAATTLTLNNSTFAIAEPTTLTISNYPNVITTAQTVNIPIPTVIVGQAPAKTTGAPLATNTPVAPGYVNGPAAPLYPTGPAAITTFAVASTRAHNISAPIETGAAVVARPGLYLMAAAGVVALM